MITKFMHGADGETSCLVICAAHDMYSFCCLYEEPLWDSEACYFKPCPSFSSWCFPVLVISRIPY